MSNFYTPEYKLKLAKNIITNFCSDITGLGCNNQSLKEIQKIERRYNKSKGRYCDLSDFCIRLSDIPQIHYKLMTTVNWLDCITGTPVKKQTGFYKSAYCDKQGLTQVEHFITVDRYIQLLFIELNIRDMYKEIAA